MDSKLIQCELCGVMVLELCNDLVCRACHKTESFTACLRNSQANRIRQSAGLRALPPSKPITWEDYHG